MASRYPMPNVYTKEKKTSSSSSSSSSSASDVAKSFLNRFQSYPAVASSASRYPLPTVYAAQPSSKSASQGNRQQQHVSAGPRSSVESWDTVDQIKYDQMRS
ncbi:uncharacterized protein CTRU02_215026 [Colletotrichum truncatum]|uniref:Uncharacterized protein n=1 Tax=Colletotrichum truncatum TaxID=5467 RepID=A0ACC3YEC1_COLTU|nr:uncharacterized protein CTRU02_08221 [Colletotrichum truncatum]KAF6790092.1 hypothetical protein CTRU02_08221 [Colletotrichum truncatum]